MNLGNQIDCASGNIYLEFYAIAMHISRLNFVMNAAMQSVRLRRK